MLKMTTSELTTIPSIGKKMAVKLIELGYPTVASLRDVDPDVMYKKYEAQCGCHVDRCVLYTFRCAVAYARDPVSVAGKNWWHFKD